MDRAYSFLEVKAIDEGTRELTGIASTPSPDRMDDIVEPKGVEMKLPLPFLWQHNHEAPIGHVTSATVKANGIEVKVKLVKIDEAGRLRDRLDEAWQSIKSGLVRGLSIGFRPIESANIDGGWGRRYLKWEMLELSAVTVAANADCTIQTVKSIDRSIRAASGQTDRPVVRLDIHPGVSGEKQPTPKTGENDMSKMTFGEQIAAFEAKRAANVERMGDIMNKAGEKGETLDAAAAEEHDTLQAEVEQIDDHLKRLRASESAIKSQAKHVDGGDQARASATRDPATVRATQKLDKGIGFARLARVKALAFTGQVNGLRDEREIAKTLYPSDDGLMASLTIKAPVSAANTLDPTWAGNMINEGGAAFADFVEFLRERSLYGQIASRFRRLPFDAPVLVQGSGGTAQWVKEGDAKPLTQWTYTRAKLTPLKVAAIAAATKETLMRASASADAFLRDELARAVGSRIDSTLISEAPAVADESPAGLLQGTTPLVVSGGGTIQDIRCDIAAFLKALVGDNLTVSGAFWVMPETVAIDLSLATNEVGAPAFPGITPTGGTLAGLPVFTSQYVPSDSAGPVVALIKGDEIFLGDEGGIQVSVSDQATLNMDSAPTQDSITPTASQGVSMWQTNSVAFLVERFVNWQKRRASAVVWAQVNWSTCS